MAAYQVVLFDADGTLLDFHQAEEWALAETFNAMGINYRVQHHLPIYREQNARIWEEYELGHFTSEQMRVERFRRFLSAIGVDADPDQFGSNYLRFLAQGDQMITGAQEIVEKLSRVVRMSVITNGLSDVQRARFRRSPLTPYFDSIIISEEVGARKPEPQIFDAVMNSYANVDRSDVLMVGDSLSSDIAGGNRAGMHTCWFNPGGAARGETQERPTYEIRELFELSDLLHRA
ncbi:MAG TPA: YjjG family noncanonical pyrimidine nucleotidase [Spirochaetia bacterium]|nr:YjjG family noncanonical pyrimidine nucleotidase [Spirochaetia bacterium]